MNINTKTLIPKTLIYCNFGNHQDTELEQICKASWERNFPKNEWTWIELNENNFNIKQFKYTRIAYEKGYYSLVSDFARYYYLYLNGGVYVDKDYYALKPLTKDILDNPGFIGCYDMFYNTDISWGIFGTKQNNLLIENILVSLNNLDLEEISYKSLWKLNIPMKKELQKYWFISPMKIKKSDNFTYYPFTYFTCNTSNDKIAYKTKENSYGIHLYGNSWKPLNEEQLNKKIQKIKDYLWETKKEFQKH